MFDPSKYYPTTSSIPPAYFTGREAEIEFLKTRIIDEGKTIGLITGDRRIGKTSLAMYFADRLRKEFNTTVEFVNLETTGQTFRDLQKDCKLVIFDDLETNFHPDISSKILTFIDQNPNQQYLLVGQTADALLHRHINYELKLKPLADNNALQLLMRQLENRLPQNEILKLVELSQGQPYIINLILHYLEDVRRPYTIEELRKIIFEKISVSGIRDLAGQIILPENPVFQKIKNDILIVNGNALQKLKMNPNLIHSLKPREFEEMMAELMEKRGYKVDLTQATRDGGKDLIVARHNDFGNFIYYVECKQYSPGNPVGVSLVRELMGTVHADKVTAGILITSSYFSPDAINYSKKVEHQISLVDFLRLREWLNNI